MAFILLWNSAVRVHDSQAYRKMDVTRSYLGTERNTLVNPNWFQPCLESISGLEPSSVITELRYLKLVT